MILWAHTTYLLQNDFLKWVIKRESVHRIQYLYRGSLFLFWRQNFSFSELFLLVFARLSGPKQSLDKKRLPQKPDPLIALKLHFLFCSQYLYQSFSRQHCVRCWEAQPDQDRALEWTLWVAEEILCFWRGTQSLGHPCSLQDLQLLQGFIYLPSWYLEYPLKAMHLITLDLVENAGFCNCIVCFCFQM